MSAHLDHFIDNKWLKGSGMPFSTHNPATGEIVWQGHSATADEVHQAVSAARIAFETWLQKTPEERIGYMQRYVEALQKSGDKIPLAISKEVGKPLWESRTELAAMINKVSVSIEAYQKRCAEVVREFGGGLSITRYKPHGVIAIFGPFNFPGHIANGQIVPALLAGNTIILKPSEFTPAAPEEMMKCFEECGLPKGVVNMIQGGRDTGKLLASDHSIDGLFFTGSWETGRILSEQFAKTPEKILALELGGNNPLLIGDVSDLKSAALMTIQSAYITAGQRCTCARRLIVPKGEKGDAFLNILADLVRKIKVGPYTDTPEPFMGPVVSQGTADHLLTIQDTLKKRGAKSIVELRLLQTDTALVSPGLIDVTNVRNRPDEEIFGPLLQVIRVLDLDAGITEANNTAFGLTAGLLSDKKQEYEKFYKKIRAGVITWNTPLTGASGAAAPFGGIKRSGNHRPSGYFTVDYCTYPVASVESPKIKPPEIPPGIAISNE